MQFATFAIALLAGISEAKTRNSHVVAENPSNDVTCYHGNQREFPVSGPNTPPCWYREPDNVFSCYQVDPDTGKCPGFPNPVRRPISRPHPSGNRQDGRKQGNYRVKTANSPNGVTCYHGNQKEFPVYGQKAPPCWYKEADGSISCYQYDPATGKCPNFPNPIIRSARNRKANGSSEKGDNSQHGIKQGVNKQEEKKQDEAPPKATDSPSDSTCYVANQKEYPINLIYAPPCWFKEADGSTSCYEYDPATGKCPNFPNPIPNKISGTVTHHEVDSNTCYAGNMRDKPIQDPKRELCWYKQEDGTNACFDKVDGKCPF